MSDARKEGLTEGLRKGEALGLEKGKMEIAANLLKKGMTIEEVSNVTGLPKQHIEKFI